jgi:N-glycosylase/DNA lyase
VALRQTSRGLLAKTALPTDDWTWLADYLQIDFDLDGALRTFPSDPVLRAAVGQHHGLRLLRQDPWVCLASFLLSATKQIAQIRQVYQKLCREFGRPVNAPPGYPRSFAFPEPSVLASAGEDALRGCRMGFRARHLFHAACQIADGRHDLGQLRNLPLSEARDLLMALSGVGRKIADCVLLFSGDQPQAFPIDVWVARTLRAGYFENRPVSLPQLQAFAESHFGPYAGLAQQYLFHHARKLSPDPVRLPCPANS